MNNGEHRLSIIVGVKDHIDVINLLLSVDMFCEVILILNKSNETTRKIYKNIVFKNIDLKVLEIDSNNLGFIKNLGIEHSTSNNILMLDADNILAPGTLEKIVGSLEEYDIGKVGYSIIDSGYSSKILNKARIPWNKYFLYHPGVFYRKTIKDKVGGYYYVSDLPWREDYQFAQRVQKSKLKPIILNDAIIFHPPYSFFRDIRTAYRCGGGQYIGCSTGKIIPSLKYGGTKNIFYSIAFDTVRLPVLLTYVLSIHIYRLGFLTACYKLFWKLIFMIGYYSMFAKRKIWKTL